MNDFQEIRPLRADHVGSRILMIRGRRVMLDADLAALYGVTTSNLNKAVKRNLRRFPDDFMFRLTAEESERLIFQIGISKPAGRGGSRHLHYVFTEHGVAMLSSVLRSEKAIQVNIAIMRAFARFRDVLATHRGLARKLAALEERVGTHDSVIQEILSVICELMESPPEPPRGRIGFHRPSPLFDKEQGR